MNIFQNQ